MRTRLQALEDVYSRTVEPHHPTGREEHFLPWCFHPHLTTEPCWSEGSVLGPVCRSHAEQDSELSGFHPSGGIYPVLAASSACSLQGRGGETQTFHLEISVCMIGTRTFKGRALFIQLLPSTPFLRASVFSLIFRAPPHVCAHTHVHTHTHTCVCTHMISCESKKKKEKTKSWQMLIFPLNCTYFIVFLSGFLPRRPPDLARSPNSLHCGQMSQIM